MGKSKARQGDRKLPSSIQRNTAVQPRKPQRRDPPRRRKLVWLSTVGTAGIAVLVGVLVNVLSTQAQRVVSSPSGSTAAQLVVDEVSLTSSKTTVNASGSDLRFIP